MEKRIRCRDEDSGVEASVRKESLRKKLRQAEAETETQSAELVEKFEAKRDLGRAKLRRVSIV